MLSRAWQMLLVVLLAIGVSSCAAIEGIFKAGVGVGAAAVILLVVLVLIVWAFIRGGSSTV
jgi:hypothetical protein